MTLRLDRRQVQRFAGRLALAMLVADLAGRARLLAEVQASTGLEFRATKRVSFEESRGGLDDGGLATSTAPAIFAEEGEPELLAPARLAPKAALDFFRQLIGMTRAAFDRLSKRYREAAFTVANVESVQMIEEIRGELDRALSEGLTREDFERAVDARMQTKGLSKLDPFHLETVFRTNTASAYAAGRASQMLQPDVRKALPWWEYRTVGDSRVRDEHRRLNGLIARWDDPVWSRIYPPNGYNCRCKVRALLNSQARDRAGRRGLDLSRPARLPAGVKIDFDRSPVETLAGLRRGRMPEDAR